MSLRDSEGNPARVVTKISPLVTIHQSLDIAPKSPSPRLVPYMHSCERPEEEISGSHVKVGSLDMLLVGDSIWVPNIN